MDLILPSGSNPNNLRLPRNGRNYVVDADMYGICDRIKEIDDRLVIVASEHKDGIHFTVIEEEPNGNASMVCTVTELDERLLTRLRRMVAIPVAKRLEMIEEESQREREQQEKDHLEDTFEKFGQRAWWAMEKDGLIQRPKSYAKKSIKSTTESFNGQNAS